MYLSEVLLNQSTGVNPYDWHRTLWRFFDLPSGTPRPFQFRVEQIKEKKALVLMQSSIPLECEVEGTTVQRQKQYLPRFVSGQVLRFRLKANPIKTIRDEKGRLNRRGEIKSCRVPLFKEEQQIQWLVRKLGSTATLSEVAISSREIIFFRKGRRAGKVVTATFDGFIKVQEPAIFTDIFYAGIGPAKSLGCGLLSLAPA
ncbi:MAG: type I-E CRISPR-associated protein Cas6/Cse3/CasE [Candidatus Thiodiazotropha sp. (ex Lucinoma kastoroae)]|nr:type I-E CRISPR-associated protein Cas6/Cse3/CasE [Candidatus Thiodiazotropha sp. (ex Lucinoma kastoroae)]